jgi:hypothetical protein
MFRKALALMASPDADNDELQKLLQPLKYTACFFRVRS